MASVYDEINQIKKEGSVYDDATKTSQSDWLTGYKAALNATPINQTPQAPMFASGKFAGYGESQYDKGLTFFDEMSDTGGSLENLRASNQPWYSQMGNNLVNMGVIATTTFADSFVGTAAGLVNMVFNPYDDGETGMNWGERQLDKFVNNPVSLWLNSINKSVKEELPTYHTDEYNQNMSEGKWWKNMGTSAFWGETIVENAGFTLGMVASGKVSGSLLNKAAKIGEQSNIIRNGVNKALQAGTIEGNADDIVKKILAGKQSLQGLDLTGEMAQAVKNINQLSTLNRNLATAIAVTGEARQEGINSSQEYKEQMMMRLESPEGLNELMSKTAYNLFSKNPEMFAYNPTQGDVLQSIKPEYIEAFNQELQLNREKATQEVNDAAGRVAGMDFALNFPILYGSTMWQFGRTFSKGYDTQKGFLNNLRGATRQQVNALELEGADRIVREGSQYIVKNSVGDRIIRGLKIASNPIVEANEEMMQAAAQTAATRWSGAKMNSFLGYKLDPESEQEQIGKLNSIWNGIIDTYSDPAKYQEGFAGLIMGGMGSLNFTFTKNAQGKTPIFEGGVWQDIRDARQENQDLEAAADALNKRLSDPSFLNYYQGLIRHDALEKNKTEALEKDDKFAFLNNDHAQLISDIVMFEKAGKLQDLYDNIDSNIEKYSTSDKVQISEIASELRELSKNQETNQDMLSDKTDDEIVQESLKFNQKMRESIDGYRSTVNNLKSLIGGKFLEEDDFNEMVYMFSQIDNLESRYTDLHTGLAEKLNNLKSDELHNKLFTINLDNSEKTLTLAEIINQASPSELNDFLLGVNRPETQEFDYMKALMSPNETLVGNMVEIATTIDAITNNTNKRGELTNQQERMIGGLNQNIKAIHDVLSKNKEREAIMKDMVDLIRLEDSRSKLVNTYNKYAGKPYLLRQKLKDEQVEASKKQENEINKTVKDELKEASNLVDIRNIINREVNEKNNKSIDRIISEMSLSDNADFAPLVSEYREIENLKDEVNNSNLSTSLDPKIMQGVNQLFDKIKDRANSYSEIANPDITQADLDAMEGTYFPQTQQEIMKALRDILGEVQTRNNKYNNLNSNLKPAEKESKKPEKPIYEEKPIGNINSQQAQQENETIRNAVDKKNDSFPRSSNNKVWNNGTFELDIDVYNASRRIEDQSNPIYKPAIDFLKQSGAFDYINSGKLNRGDKISFIAYKPYWDYLVENGSNEEWVNENKPLLLVVEDKNGTITQDNGKKYQIVGTFNKNLNESLHSKVSGGLNMVYNINTTVSNVTPGRLEFNNEKLLSTLQGQTPWGETIEMLFGIATDTGQLETNLDKVNYEIFNVTPTNNDFSNSGRLYLLTKSAVSDTYIPTSVRAKTLNEVDYSKDTPLFNELRASLMAVSKASLTGNEESVAKAVHDLRNILYVGSKAGLSINFRKDSLGPRTEYNLVLSRNNSTTEIVNVGSSELREVDSSKFSDNGVEEVFNFNTEEQITDGLLNALSTLKAPFQINKNNINGKWNVRQSLNYNDVLLQSDILTTNLANNYVRGAYFVMNPLDNNLSEVQNSNTTATKKTQNTSTPTVTNSNENTYGKSITIKEGTYFLNEKGEILDNKGSIIKDAGIINRVKVSNYLKGLSTEEIDKIKFSGKEMFDGGLLSSRIYYLLPSGQVWDSITETMFGKDSMYGLAIQNLIKQRETKFTEEDSTSVPFIEEGDQVEEEMSLFGNTPSAQPAKKERKRPTKGSAASNVSNTSSSSSMNKEEVQRKIDENKDFQKDNCNGIAPV